MGVSRFFHVESKFYEIVRHGNELRIIERGKRHMSHVTMVSATARWCHDILVEFTTLPPDQNAFRSLREGNKVFVIQKQRNGKGRFASVTVLGETKERGVVIILKGRDAGGWRGFSHEINGALTPAILAVPKVNHQREQSPPPAEIGAQRSSKSNGDLRSFKEVVILGNQIPKFPHVNVGSPTESRNCSNSEIAEIVLKVIINRGPENKWVVKWAGVLDNPSDPALSHNPVDSKDEDIGPRELIKPNKEARPKSLAAKSISKAGSSSNHVHKPVTKPTVPGHVERSKTQIHGSGSEATRVPEVSVSNRFSIFQVGESSGTSSSADLTPPQAVCSGADLTPPQASCSSADLTPPQAACSTISTPLADASLLLSGSNSQDDGKLISPVICPLPTEIDRTWGSSSAWVLELRDGRRVSIPLSLLRQPVVTASLPTDSVDAGQLVTREELVGVGSTVDDLSSLGGSLGGSEYSGAEDESEDDISLVWEDREVDGVGSELVCWGDEAETLDVEPLAISKPVENELQEVVTHTQELEVVVSPSGVEDSSPGVEVSPSDWVLGKSKRIGKVLGASYHGNEERINRLLMEIDGRRPQISCEVGGVKKLKEGRKGTRELKRLTCSINYESESAKSRGKSRERVLSISQ